VFFPCGRTLEIGRSPLGFDRRLVAFDKHCPILLENFEFGQMIQGRGIFDVARSNVEAG
jgi:hypothetical protein